MRNWAWISVAVVLSGMFGCNGSSNQPISGTDLHLQTREPHDLVPSDKPSNVMFDLQSKGKQSDTHRLYSATYQKNGKTARFQIAFDLNSQTNGGIRSGKGSFIAIPGSDASAFLSDLKEALGATHAPGNKIRVSQLPFELAILGEHQKRKDDGSFVDADNGSWTAAKLFIKGGEYEVFLNFEADGGKAEFAMKDSDYGDGVLRELAKVL